MEILTSEDMAGGRAVANVAAPCPWEEAPVSCAALMMIRGHAQFWEQLAALQGHMQQTAIRG